MLATLPFTDTLTDSHSKLNRINKLLWNNGLFTRRSTSYAVMFCVSLTFIKGKNAGMVAALGLIVRQK
jgi:hypothetical protein